jgi:hypothetical protein
LVFLADPRPEDLLFVVDLRRADTLGTVRVSDLKRIVVMSSGDGKKSAAVKTIGAGKMNVAAKKIAV